jgi:hypothetical protein
MSSGSHAVGLSKSKHFGHAHRFVRWPQKAEGFGGALQTKSRKR